MPNSALLYFRTLRHLKPVQIYGRVWRQIYRPAPELAPAPPLRTPGAAWTPTPHKRHSMFAPTRCRFLNEEHEIVTASDWDNPTWEKLWRYNLHYFDDLNAVDAEGRTGWHRAFIARWIAENPPAAGTGWEPYPVSLRIVNWIKWHQAGNPLHEATRNSLAVQLRYLGRTLETHLLGNHLFANAKAMVFGGLYFSGPEAERWLEEGLTILQREVAEQVLPDGGQFERSPMYHALAFEDVLDLINATNALADGVPQKWQAFVHSWPALAQRMRAWLTVMCHPDGEISFFNDAAIGIAPSPAELKRYASVLISPPEGTAPGATADSLRVVHLADSGYVRADAPDAALLIDVAPVGPDYLPGHAHADTLSFELSLFGQRVIVNGGTSRYGLGPEREAERGTPAHSTVTVDDQNSSEVWAGFRVARRARPFDLSIRHEGERLWVSCAHDGYRRLAGGLVHRRTWLFRPGSLRVEDQVEGKFKSAIARFHLHPAVECTLDESGSSGSFRVPGGQAMHWRVSGGSTRVEHSSYCPEFGRRDPTQCLAVEFKGVASVCMELTW